MLENEGKLREHISSGSRRNTGLALEKTKSCFPEPLQKGNDKKEGVFSMRHMVEGLGFQGERKGKSTHCLALIKRSSSWLPEVGGRVG